MANLANMLEEEVKVLNERVDLYKAAFLMIMKDVTANKVGRLDDIGLMVTIASLTQLIIEQDPEMEKETNKLPKGLQDILRGKT